MQSLYVEMESIVVQLTNEMVEVLWNFYRALTTVSVCILCMHVYMFLCMYMYSMYVHMYVLRMCVFMYVCVCIFDFAIMLC